MILNFFKMQNKKKKRTFRVRDFFSCQKSKCVHVSGILKRKQEEEERTFRFMVKLTKIFKKLMF